MMKENKKKRTTTIPLAACLPAASDANDDDTDTRETIARALDALACASNEVCADVERRVDRLVAKAMEMDERVHACERKIANAQRRRRRTGNNRAQSTTTTTKTGHEGGEVLVLESSRKYVLVSDEDEDETETVDDGKTGGERRPMYYDETTRNALQRANENKPKRRAFKDVERMATNARRYGQSARALARSFAKKQGKAGRADGAEPKTKDIGDKDNGSQFSQYVKVATNIASYDRTSLADMMPAKTAFYDCEELRFGGKGKDKRNAPGEEVTEDGNKEEGLLRDEFAEKLLLSSPPPKSIAPPVMRSVRMPGAAENASTSTLGANDDGEASMSAKKSLESAFSFRPKASEAPFVVFPEMLPSPTPLTRKNAAGEQNRQKIDGASDLYEFTLTSENPYSPSAFLRDPRRRKAQSSASKKKKGESIPSTLKSRKSSVRNNSDSSSNVTINNRDAQLSSSSPPPSPPPPSAKQDMPPRVADDGGRGALMEAIRKGAKLRKVNASTDENAPRRSPVANTNDNDNSVASTTKTGTGETIKPATSRGSAQMSMMEELASQLQRRRSTVISSQKKSTK